MHYNGCNYLSMLGLKLNHVSKRGPRGQIRICICKYKYKYKYGVFVFVFDQISNHVFVFVFDPPYLVYLPNTFSNTLFPGPFSKHKFMEHKLT